MDRVCRCLLLGALYGMVMGVPNSWAANLVVNSDTTVDATNPLDNRPFSVEVVRGVTGPTHLRITDGGTVGLDLLLLGDSSLQMTGGEILGELTLEGTSGAIISGGTIGDNVRLEGANRLSLSGDAVLVSDLRVAPTSSLLMTGGLVRGEGNSEALDIAVAVSGTASVSGGNILADIGFHLGILGAGVVTVVGKDLVLQPLVDPPLVEDSEFGILTGSLADGTPIEWNVWFFKEGTLELVPEPSCALGMGLGLCLVFAVRRHMRAGR